MADSDDVFSDVEGEVSMKCNMQPPNLNKFACYEDFKDRVELWRFTTDQKPIKLGTLLANALPDVSKRYGNKIGTALLKKHSARELYVPGGLDIVMKYLDEKLGKSKILSEITAFEGIYLYRRQPDQGIVPFISEFDLRLNTCTAAGLKLPDSVAAYILLLSSKLNNTQHELIKGLIDVEKENKDDNLYEKIKEKMTSMLTSSLGNVVGEATEKDPFGAEAFLADHEEVYASWKNKKGGWKPSYNSKDGKYSNGGFNKGNNTRDMNAKGPNGQVLRCRTCGAHNHFHRECPFAKKEDKYKAFQKFKGKNGKVYMCQVDSSDEESCTKDNSDEELYYTAVMYTTDRKELSRFTAEAINCGALDSCCTCTCAGKKWFSIYVQALPADMKHKVEGPFKSGKTFMFGNEGKLTAEQAYRIPIRVAGKIRMIQVEIIDSDIPLLLSKVEMKNLGMTLDMKNDAAYIDGKPLKVSTTSAGHLIMDLLEQEEMYLLEEILVIDLLKADEKEQEKLLNKVHKQFGHRSKRTFVSLLKDTGKWLPHFSVMLDKIINNCEGCILRKKTPDRPSVALPRASDFNEILTMDLKIWDGKYILYMIDMFSRYTVATVIPRKKPNEVVDSVFKHWVKYFGVPGCIMTDNGGEFTGEEIRRVTSYLNVYKDTTAAEAPWMNGVNERNHALADNILRQVVRDYPELDLATAIAWACTAKNSLSNVYGYSPFQLVFGKNPKLPNVINDPPSSWTIKPQSEALLKNLKALHATREAFIKAEKSEKLKIALKTKIRSVDRIYKPGDYAFYKRDKDEDFLGPAKVILQDGKIIWLRHGSYVCKVSINRIVPVSDELARGYRAAEVSADDKIPNLNIKTEESDDDSVEMKVTDQCDNETNHSNTREKQSNAKDDEDNDGDEESESDQEAGTVNSEDQEIQDQGVHNPVRDHESNHEEHSDESSIDDFDDCNGEEAVNDDQIIEEEPVVIKKNERLEIRTDEQTDGKWEKATVTGRAGKAKQWPDHWNFQCDNGKKFYANIKEVELRKMPEEEALAVYTHEDILAVMIPRDKQGTDECIAAKNAELKKLADFDTYQVVEDVGQKYITCTWVMTQKGEEARARLTARGFQEEAEFPSDSPTLQSYILELY